MRESRDDSPKCISAQIWVLTVVESSAAPVVKQETPVKAEVKSEVSQPVVVESVDSSVAAKGVSKAKRIGNDDRYLEKMVADAERVLGDFVKGIDELQKNYLYSIIFSLPNPLGK